ncbi:tetratricopeptide repeat protein [uncultured Cohaesibacter sp.]|uniref:tetratricopeptide repeat protein n=1 Tax=uncultured Cohaesibacter sp. TaxID=1002546 RepID=UPI0029C820A6|nr:tetratricopeptide repeat protein [uncultured Cohaesibacter sp.]
MQRMISALILIFFATLGSVQAQKAPPAGSIMAEAKAETDAGNLSAALELYKKAYANNEQRAAEQLARLYMEGGEGITVDYAAAKDWAQKAIDAGESRGLLYLGKIWMEGLGVTKNLDKALSYFQQANEAGDMKAGRYVGLIMAEQGNDAAAAEWFKKAAEAGDITSQYYLGRAYQTGKGVEQDFAAALLWYEKSASRGDIIASDGMVGLASLYENGQGVPTDVAKAKTLYQKAATLGNETAKADLARLGQ